MHLIFYLFLDFDKSVAINMSMSVHNIRPHNVLCLTQQFTQSNLKSTFDFVSSVMQDAFGTWKMMYLSVVYESYIEISCSRSSEKTLSDKQMQLERLVAHHPQESVVKPVELLHKSAGLAL